MADTPNPLELLFRSQQAALKLATDTARALRENTLAGVTPGEGYLGQMSDAAQAVVGLSTAMSGLAAASIQPLEEFVTRQRELAESAATVAKAQADLAAVAAKLAERHAEAVTALEKLSAPLFALADSAKPPSARRHRAAANKKAEPKES
jgi:hypothetical protein